MGHFPFIEKFQKFCWKFPSGKKRVPFDTKFHSFPGCPPSLHSCAMHAKIKDVATNSLELVKLVNGPRISIGKLSNGKTGLPFQTFRCSQKFSTGMTRKVVFHLLSNWNFWNLLVNGKRQWFLSISFSWSVLGQDTLPNTV